MLPVVVLILKFKLPAVVFILKFKCNYQTDGQTD